MYTSTVANIHALLRRDPMNNKEQKSKVLLSYVPYQPLFIYHKGKKRPEQITSSDPQFYAINFGQSYLLPRMWD